LGKVGQVDGLVHAFAYITREAKLQSILRRFVQLVRFTSFETRRRQDVISQSGMLLKVGKCNRCRLRATRLVNKYNLFVPEVLKAWIDPAQKDRRPSTITDTVGSLWMAR
jgi:hypothetical protein